MKQNTLAISFQEIYEKYSKDIYRFTLYLSGNATIAEDLTAETFLRIWETGALGRAISVKGYLLAIARNLYLRELRHLDKRRPLPDDLHKPGSLSSEVEARQELGLVKKELASLPEIDRSIFLARVVEALPYEEIASIFGVSVAAAKVKVHRSRMRLLAVRKEWNHERH